MLDMGEPVPSDGIAVTEDDQIQFFQRGRRVKPVRAWVEVGYERSKGTKILTTTPLAPASLSLRPNRTLLKHEWLFAVDTNTRVLRSADRVSVAAVARADLEVVGDEAVSVRANVIVLYEMHNISGDAERVGWWQLIQGVMADPKYRMNKPVGIVVDAHLGRLHDFNSRSEPIWEDMIIPPGMELIYASADAGKENVANMLIQLCDRESRDLLAHIEAGGGEPGHLEPASQKPFTHFRLWQNAELFPPAA